MNAQKGCCDCLFRCFKGNSNQQVKENSHNNSSVQKQKTLPLEQPPPENLNVVDHNPARQENQNEGNVAVKEQNYVNMPVINSKFKAEEILSHIVPDRAKAIKYNCPICLKFYNHILILQCCMNYICQFCINDYIDTTNKYATPLKLSILDRSIC